MSSRRRAIAIALGLLLVSCARHRHHAVGRDGAIVDRAPCAIAGDYATWVKAYGDDLAFEANKSGLDLELAETPADVIYPRAEYEALQRAGAAGRCVKLRYFSDGLRVTGFVVRPKIEPGVRRPAILFARGGNRELGKIDEHVLMDFQRFADAGFVVIGTQYRGVDGGEGKDEFGGADVDDVLALVPLARALPDVDGDNLFLLGGSRGGMEELLAIKRKIPVNAAAARSPALDLQEVGRQRPEMREVFSALIPGFADHEVEELRKRSPMAWPEAIDVPFLFFQARQDWRVPFGDATRFDVLLRAHDKPHELVVYERDGHGLWFHREDVLARTIAWFRRFQR